MGQVYTAKNFFARLLLFFIGLEEDTDMETPNSFQCAVCGKGINDDCPVDLGSLRPSVRDQLPEQAKAAGDDEHICPDCLDAARMASVKAMLSRDIDELDGLERQVYESLGKRELISRVSEGASDEPESIGARIADQVAAFGGSWAFIGIFAVILLVWIVLNVALASKAFDPYPFILMNLILSTLAALQAPVIMMSQNRQEAKDRKRSENDYMVNLKAELEIRFVHEKLDHLLYRQMQNLMELQDLQLEALKRIEDKRGGTA